MRSSAARLKLSALAQGESTHLASRCPCTQAASDLARREAAQAENMRRLHSFCAVCAGAWRSSDNIAPSVPRGNLCFFFFRTTVMSENAVAAAMSTKSKSLMAAAVIEVSPLVMRDRLNRCLRSRQLFPAVQQQRC